MPVRSLGSSVLRWPDAHAVDEAVRAWAKDIGGRRSDVMRIGYFGSYARGDWGVGSDVDLVIVVSSTEQPPERRAIDFDATRLPVPTDVLVYSLDEWESLSVRSSFAPAGAETVWVLQRDTGFPQ